MTLPDELLDWEAPPGIRFIRAWLLGLPGTGAGAMRDPKHDVLPFTQIQRYDGRQDLITDVGFYQLDHLAKATDDKTAFTACEDYARLCTRRILYLRDHSWTEVNVPGWGLVTADFVACRESPHEEPYPDPAIARMVSRYRIDLRLVSAA